MYVLSAFLKDAKSEIKEESDFKKGRKIDRKEGKKMNEIWFSAV
jgi:hypothetical protein